MVKPPSLSPAPYCFVSGHVPVAESSSLSKYVLSIRQQPHRAKVCGVKERDRRPIDPPPIVQIKLADPASDKNNDYLQSPYLFICCNLVPADDPTGEIVLPAHRALAGTVVSSLNRLKDVDNSDGGFFVFGDMSIRLEGHFRLRFTLFELGQGQVVHIMSMASEPLTVHSSKTFPGMSESTFLSRSFSDQGVRIRIRKEHHVKPKMPSPDAASAKAPTALLSPSSSCHEADHSEDDSHNSTAPPKSRRTPSVAQRSPVAKFPSHQQSPPCSPGSVGHEPGHSVSQDHQRARPAPLPSRTLYRHHPYMSPERYSWTEVGRHPQVIPASAKRPYPDYHARSSEGRPSPHMPHYSGRPIHMAFSGMAQTMATPGPLEVRPAPYGQNASRMQTKEEFKHPVFAKTFHCRTPSMSSQHSEGCRSSPEIPGERLESFSYCQAGRECAGVKLPSIHSLPTNSPMLAHLPSFQPQQRSQPGFPPGQLAL